MIELNFLRINSLNVRGTSLAFHLAVSICIINRIWTTRLRRRYTNKLRENIDMGKYTMINLLRITRGVRIMCASVFVYEHLLLLSVRGKVDFYDS